MAQPEWRPFTLKKRFLTALIIICLSLIIAVEVVVQISNRNDGLFFANDHGKFPTYALFYFEYLPTIISILHSLIWLCVENDSRRVEPFYQMSKPGGATAKDSLLLDYRYQFILEVPYTSFRNRHWVVLCGSLIGIIGAFAATPLMSAVMDQETVTRNLQFTTQDYRFVPLEDQSLVVSSKFTRDMYRHKYLGDPLPRFVNYTFATRPFQSIIVDDKPWTGMTNELWTFSTTQYETELDCEVATRHVSNATDAPLDPMGPTFTSSKDCSFSFDVKEGGHMSDRTSFRNGRPFTLIAMSHAPTYYIWTVRSGAIRETQLSLNDQECPNRNIFLAIFNYEDDPVLMEPDDHKNALYYLNTTEYTVDRPNERAAAIFCEPRYYSRPVKAVLNSRTGAVWGLEYLGERISIDSQVNSTHMIDLAMVGVTAVPGVNVTKDLGGEPEDPFGFPDLIHVLEEQPLFKQDPGEDGRKSSQFPTYSADIVAVENGNIHLPGSTGKSLSLFAISDLDDLKKLVDPNQLTDVYTTAFKQFFAFAVAEELTAPAQDTHIAVHRRFRVRAYVANALFARLLQAAWGVLILLAIGIGILNNRRPLHLASDPGSLAALMASISESPELLKDFKDSEILKYKETAHILMTGSKHRYVLEATGDGGHRIKVVEPDKSLPRGPTVKSRLKDGVIRSNTLELSVWYGVAMCVVMAAIIVVSTAFRIIAIRNNGLSVGKMTDFVKSLCFSYIPTAVATGIELFIVFVTRYVALVSPFDSMRKASSPHRISISSYYERLPPHFLAFYGFRNTHYLLVAAIIGIFAANVITVALSGLFIPIVSAKDYEIIANRAKWPIINGTETEMVPSTYYRIERNDIPLPPWTTEEFYILPFTATSESSKDIAGSRNITGETWAIGAKIECTKPNEMQMNRTENIDRPSINETRRLGVGPKTGIGMNYYFVSTSHTVDISPYGLCPGAWNSSKRVSDGYYGLGSPTGDRFTRVGMWNYYDMDTYQYTANRDHIARWWNASMLYHEAFASFSRCPGVFSVGFGKFKVGHVPRGAKSPDNGYILAESAYDLADTVKLCQSALRISKVIATVDLDYQVLKTEIIEDVELDTVEKNDTQFVLSPTTPAGNIESPESRDSPSISRFLGRFNQLIMRQTERTVPVRMDEYPQTWLGYLTMELTQHAKNNYDGHGNGGLYQPDLFESDIMPALHKAYAKIFAVWISTTKDKILAPTFEDDHQEQISVIAVKTEDRLTVSKVMWILAVVCLACLILFLIVFYTLRPGNFLPHVPTTLAATISYIYASNILDIMHHEAVSSLGKTGLLRWLDAQNFRYGHGWFVGRDGARHLGVDYEAPKTEEEGGFEMGLKRMGTGLLGKLAGGKGEKGDSQYTLVATGAKQGETMVAEENMMSKDSLLMNDPSERRRE
ncbi:hypothetical protein EX30DRAFT_340391 [Ascodesmis nigricans]|uniref:Uncharacterized protein n=1 Tax=Ascodesmis nigricans TaxID=341454 RepID=A0A4S2MYW5_9PEZI|nr:hypothetical protein EX30DRAFT_340391 [Ascodesmis nigricans]